MLNIYSANGPGGLAFPALRGMSAYEIAVKNGFEGTEKEWLESLKGERGEIVLDPARGLLWKNDAPNECMETETIVTLPDMSQYDGVEIVYAMTESMAEHEFYGTPSYIGGLHGRRGLMSTGFIPIESGNNTVTLEQGWIGDEYSGSTYAQLTTIVHRYVDVFVGDTCTATISGIVVASGASDGAAGSWFPHLCIPCYIYGIKSAEIASCASGGVAKPLILDANLSDHYGGHAEAGDEALEAIETGRQILVRVPNASGDNYVASYSPIYFYQLPCDGQYLYLFYLKDEKQDLSALLGQPAGTVLLPTYGQFQMLLSKYYNSNPLDP